MPFASGSISVGDASSAEFVRFGGDLNTPYAFVSDYGVLLEKLKEFLCGKMTKPVAGVGNTGNGTIHSFDVKNPLLAESDDWLITFTDATHFTVEGDSHGAVGGSYELVVPVGMTSKSKVISTDMFQFVITEGSIPFATGDTFTFSTTLSPLGDQAYEVIADTARGTGGTNNLFKEVVKTEVNGPNTGTVEISTLLYYGQESINQTIYLDFFSATEFSVKDGDGVIFTTGTVNTLLEYRTPTLSFLLRVTALTGSPTYKAAASSNGIPPTTIYSGDSRTNFKIYPPRNAAPSDTRITRVLILKATGLAGLDTTYFTFSQRVGGSANGDRYYLDCALHRMYSPLLRVFQQQRMSPVCRIKNHQGATVDYNFMGDGRSFKVLTELTSQDFQVMAAGLFLPHSTPSSYPWPGFVLGTIGNLLFTPAPGESPVARADETPGFNPGFSSVGSSTLWCCLPTGTWKAGKNAVDTAGIANPGSYTINMNMDPNTFDGVYTDPWVHRQSRPVKISPEVYGEPAKKAIYPGIMKFASSTLRGVLGELPGIFFFGQSTTTPVDAGTTVTIGSDDYLIWCGTTLPQASAAVTAAFLKD